MSKFDQLNQLGLYSHKVMLFGLWNALATSKRLMNMVVVNLEGCAVVVYSDSWDSDVWRLRSFFEFLSAARLTVKLEKCDFACATLT